MGWLYSIRMRDDKLSQKFSIENYRRESALKVVERNVKGSLTDVDTQIEPLEEVALDR